MAKEMAWWVKQALAVPAWAGVSLYSQHPPINLDKPIVQFVVVFYVQYDSQTHIDNIQ